MLDKLLKLYKDASIFEIGDGFVSGYDGKTFATVLDKRFLGFPEGNIENADLTRLIESESFGCEENILWIKNGDKKEFIKPHKGLLLNCKVSAKGFGRPQFESEPLFKALKKAKPSEAPYIGFEGSKARIFNSDWTPIFEVEVPTQIEQEVLYSLKLIKKALKMKNSNPAFSIIEFGGRIHSLRLYWEDFDIYIANFVRGL